MARTTSNMVELGTAAPSFSLPDPAGRTFSLDEVPAGEPILVVFLSNHCPFVKHLGRPLAEFGREFIPRGLHMVGVNSNDIEAYPADAPALMAVEIEELGYPFPYVFDETQEVAKAYGAACTPDFFLYDGERRLAYRGQFDSSRPSLDVPTTGADLRAAVETVLAGEAPEGEQRPSVGCNIKWKPGNEPDYFA